ncbi:alpha-trehalose-phosphate synthase [Striga asiatica]|uniref:Alpha-trehalose-phosphate synthase n=1 Tax=Striga asiatica TaxID=4170 RepID=A0A5A7P3W3_STRAF|nr:alpha-trehalose-phosphate synthase [Striga asiatica]
MQSRRNTWPRSVAKAAVRHRQRQAVTSSNVVQRRLRLGWRRERRAEISAGPKKNERCTRLSSGMESPSGKVSYSRCARVTRGGSRAVRSCRSQTGRMEGLWAPMACSPMADINWTRPLPSAMHQRTTRDAAGAWDIVKQLFKAMERRLRADYKLR